MKIIEEFKTFVMRGNVVDLAVGVIIGAAFGKIVTALVSDIIMPPIGKAIGNLDFTNLYLPLSDKVKAAQAAAEAHSANASNLTTGTIPSSVFPAITPGSPGTAIASATTIAPIAEVTHVTGTAAISTITAPYSGFGGCVILIADGAWTTVTGGNIFAAMTATVGTPYRACYDGTTWYVK